MIQATITSFINIRAADTDHNTREGAGELTFAVLYHPSQSQTETLCESPGAIDTAPKLLSVCSSPEDLRSATMILLPSAPVPSQMPSRCSPFSFEPGLLPIHVRTRPASAKKQASFAAFGCPYFRGIRSDTLTLALFQVAPPPVPQAGSVACHSFPKPCLQAHAGPG